MRRIFHILILVVAIFATIYSMKALNNIETEIAELEQRVERLENDNKDLKEAIEILNNRTVYVGEASYYSEDGCVGCREDRIMANGERFDEDSNTLAMNKIPLNTNVEVINLATNDKMTATVTDTGGFDKLGRIADLSLGLKEQLNCTDLCDVAIIEEAK